jgi:hypothetical protein
MTEPTEPTYVAPNSIRDALPAARAAVRVQPWQVPAWMDRLVEGLDRSEKLPASLVMTKGATPDVLHIEVRIHGLNAEGQQHLVTPSMPSTPSTPSTQPERPEQP